MALPTGAKGVESRVQVGDGADGCVTGCRITIDGEERHVCDDISCVGMRMPQDLRALGSDLSGIARSGFEEHLDSAHEESQDHHVNDSREDGPVPDGSTPPEWEAAFAAA
ncbi:MAG TPA: hypothetical protein EYQ46_20465 [Myxococcales bacterium]|nr:hypothetical protein [Myxococcales bacterium]HIL80338.1 hypothetical protein [Myxococcales bacterium]